jgi:hypothetical protein
LDEYALINDQFVQLGQYWPIIIPLPSGDILAFLVLSQNDNSFGIAT